MNLIKLVIISTCFAIFFCLAAIDFCQAHDAFYPHPHMRDLKAMAKRGKILVITLVVSAGLMALISTAIIRGDKWKEKVDDPGTMNPAELRAYVIVAASAGRHALAEGRGQALYKALFQYARARGINWEIESIDDSASVTCSIGKDQVTVNISEDNTGVEVRAIRGNMGASATASVDDESVRSSIFTSVSSQ